MHIQFHAISYSLKCANWSTIPAFKRRLTGFTDSYASAPNKDDTARVSGFLECVDETVREINVTYIWDMDESA